MLLHLLHRLLLFGIEFISQAHFCRTAFGSKMPVSTEMHKPPIQEQISEITKKIQLLGKLVSFLIPLFICSVL